MSIVASGEDSHNLEETIMHAQRSITERTISTLERLIDQTMPRLIAELKPNDGQEVSSLPVKQSLQGAALLNVINTFVANSSMAAELLRMLSALWRLQEMPHSLTDSITLDNVSDKPIPHEFTEESLLSTMRVLLKLRDKFEGGFLEPVVKHPEFIRLYKELSGRYPDDEPKGRRI